MVITPMQTTPGRQPVTKNTVQQINLAWFDFWMFLIVFIICDNLVFINGYDTFLQSHKTEQEKELQQLKIQQLKLQVQLLKKG